MRDTELSFSLCVSTSIIRMTPSILDLRKSTYWFHYKNFILSHISNGSIGNVVNSFVIVLFLRFSTGYLLNLDD